MDTEDSDGDCVIFKNSPLHEYLQATVKQDCFDTDVVIPASSNCQLPSKHIEAKEFEVDREQSDMSRQFDIEAMEMVLNSSLLDEDDEKLLTNLQLRLGSSGVRLSRQIYPKSAICVSMVGMLLMCILARLMVPVEYFHEAIAPLQSVLGLTELCSVETLDLALCTVALVPWVAVCCRFLAEAYAFTKEKFTRLQQLKRLGSFIDRQATLNRETRKSLQYLRDREVLQRGYTISSKYTAVMTSGNHQSAESSSFDSHLRQRFSQDVSELFHLYRDETKLLMNKESERLLDYPVFSIASLPLTEFGDLFTADRRLNLSLTDLKGLCDLVFLQRSEFTRHLIIRTCCRFYSQVGLAAKGIGGIWDLLTYAQSSSTSCCQNQVVQCANGLFTRLPDISRQCDKVAKEMRLISQWNSQAQLTNNKSHSTTSQSHSSLLVPLRSLKIHLQLATEKCQMGENMVESDDLSASLADLLDFVASELRSCGVCMEECRKELSGGKTDLPTDMVSVAPKPSVTGVNSKPIISVEENVVVDQVFEATVLDRDAVEDSSNVNDVDYEDDLTRRQNGTQMLTELKSVLRLRSAEMQQREREAIARMRGLPVESVPLEPIDQPQLTDVPKPRRRITLASTTADEKSQRDSPAAFSFAQLITERSKRFPTALESECFEADTNDTDND